MYQMPSKKHKRKKGPIRISKLKKIMRSRGKYRRGEEEDTHEISHSDLRKEYFYDQGNLKSLRTQESRDRIARRLDISRIACINKLLS